MVYTQVLISSVDVTNYLVSYEYERTFGDLLPELSLKFNRKILESVSVANGSPIEVWRGFAIATEEKVFSGYVERYESEKGLFTVTALDKLWDLVRKEVTTVYEDTGTEAGKLSAIFLDLVTTYGGLNADATTVQDSGTTYVLEKFICNHADPFERCKKLADTLDWQFYYRADTDKVYFEPKGFLNNTNTLFVGDNVLAIPKWQYDTTEMCNNVTIVGAYQEIETTLSGQIGVDAAFTASSITLNYEPISVKVYKGSGSPATTLLVGGMPDSTTSFDYYVDKPQKKVLPQSGSTFTSSWYYEVRYSFAAPIPVNMYDQNSIDTYGEFQKTVTYKDLRSVADAETRGTNYLVKYAKPFVFTTLKVKVDASLDLAVGQNIRVVDNFSKPSVDSTLLINKLRIRYPGDYDELDVGDRYWRLADWQAQILEKLKRVEEEEFSNQEILNNVVGINNATYSPITVQCRDVKLYLQYPADDEQFILGHATKGVLGTCQLGSGVNTPETLWQVLPGDNVFREYFTDSDYVDLSVTTAAIDTTNRRAL